MWFLYVCRSRWLSSSVAKSQRDRDIPVGWQRKDWQRNEDLESGGLHQSVARAASQPPLERDHLRAWSSRLHCPRSTGPDPADQGPEVGISSAGIPDTFPRGHVLPHLEALRGTGVSHPGNSQAQRRLQLRRASPPRCRSRSPQGSTRAGMFCITK